MRLVVRHLFTGMFHTIFTFFSFLDSLITTKLYFPISITKYIKYIIINQITDDVFVFVFYATVFLLLFFLFQPLFASSLSRRISSFMVSPTSSLFMHWLIGMVYVFYSASFVLVLREVLRPGVLWFLRNLNDPEFNPIQEVYIIICHDYIMKCAFDTTMS